MSQRQNTWPPLALTDTTALIKWYSACWTTIFLGQHVNKAWPYLIPRQLTRLYLSQNKMCRVLRLVHWTNCFCVASVQMLPFASLTSTKKSWWSRFKLGNPWRVSLSARTGTRLQSVLEIQEMLWFMTWGKVREKSTNTVQVIKTLSTVSSFKIKYPKNP